MNRERAKELLPIIEAYIDGATIQFRPVSHVEWSEWNEYRFDSRGEYRVKPESHDIKWAAEQMKIGRSVRRANWGVRVRLSRTGLLMNGISDSPMSHSLEPNDLLADEWEIYEPKGGAS